MKPFRKIRTDDRELDAVQSNVAASLTPISKVTFLDGAAVIGVELTTGVNRVGHNLKRNVTGWWITRQYAAADIFETGSSNLTLDLDASADVTVDLWVY